MDIQKIFNRLQGSWTFNRTLLSKHTHDPSGIVTGLAVFELIDTDQLHYTETGEFITVLGKPFKIHREYCYRFIREQKTIETYFVENGRSDRLFYKLEFGVVDSPERFRATGNHVCNNDHYHATYEFVGDDAFTLNYIVRGPSKDYRSETHYVLCR